MHQIRFPVRSGFHETVKQRVEQYFVDSGRSTTGDWRLFVKTGVILTWLAGSYALLVFGSTSLCVTMLAVFALAQACALVGFNIMHDGAHGSYAHSKTINGLMGGMLNVIGGSQRLWRHKHNRLHHIYTNIHTLDNDLQTSGLLRFSPAQPWRPWHRFQHGYAGKFHIPRKVGNSFLGQGTVFRHCSLCRSLYLRLWLTRRPCVRLFLRATRARSVPVLFRSGVR